MTSATLTRQTYRRPASALECQKVGGCSSRTALVSILVFALVAAAALFYVWSRTEMMREAYALSELTREINVAAEEQELLRTEAASLRSPERIETIARNELGMQFPRRQQIWNVEYEGPGADSYQSVARAVKGGVKH